MSDETKEEVKAVGQVAASAASALSWAGILSNFQKALAYIKDQAPAIALAIFNYMRSVINQKELEKKQLQLELDKGKAREKIDADNRVKSDSDIIDDAIRAGTDDGSGPTRGVDSNGNKSGSGKP